MTEYYSDRTSGPRSRTRGEIGAKAWGGIVSLFETGIARGDYAEAFPDVCLDGAGVFRTGLGSLLQAVEADVPDLDGYPRPGDIPPTPVVLDLVEFLYRHVSDASVREHHPYYQHDHLKFDRARGRSAFRDRVNTIFARNGLAYELGEDGRVMRLVPPVVDEVFAVGLPATGDVRLDDLVARAETAFFDRDPSARLDGLEKLWDAFERIKTVLDPDKRRGAKALIGAVTRTKASAELVRAEMDALTGIGNTFRIRHHETTAVDVPTELVDHLFVRLYALLGLLAEGLAETQEPSA